jgi:iron complex transport system ATP-binding protein
MPIIETTDIRVSAGQRTLLHPLSLTFEAGEMVAILGENGAGKSTLLRALAGSIPEINAHIQLNGRPLSTWTSAALAQKRSVFSQFNRLSMPLTTLEVVRMGRFPYEKSEPSQLSEDLSLTMLHRLDLKPLAERSVLSLSGGELQRVHLARVFNQLHDNHALPTDKMLLLDEPLNNLDLRYRYAALEWARQMADAGNAVVVVLHDINLAAAYADRLVFLRQGKMLANGAPAKVLTEALILRCFNFPGRVFHSETGTPIVTFERPEAPKDVVASIIKTTYS